MFALCRKFCHNTQFDEQKGWSSSRVQYCASCHCFSTGDRVSVPDSTKITSLDIVTHTLFLEDTLSLKALDSGAIYTYIPPRDARKTYCYDNVTLCKQQQLATVKTNYDPCFLSRSNNIFALELCARVCVRTPQESVAFCFPLKIYRIPNNDSTHPGSCQEFSNLLKTFFQKKGQVMSNVPFFLTSFFVDTRVVFPG